MKSYRVKIQVYDNDEENYSCLIKDISMDKYIQLIDLIGVKHIFLKDKHQLVLDNF